MSLHRFVGFTIDFASVLLLVGDKAFVSTESNLEYIGRLTYFMAASCSTITRRIPPIDQVGLVAMPLIIGAFYNDDCATLQEGPPPLMDRNTLVTVTTLSLIPTTCAAFIRI